MSHLVKIQVQITDLDALQRACEMRGLVLDHSIKRWQGYASGECECVVRDTTLHKYSVGVVKVGDHYELQADEWAYDARPSFAKISLHAKVGDKCEVLMQYYALAQAMSIAEANGHIVNGYTTDPQTGDIVLDIEDTLNNNASVSLY